MTSSTLSPAGHAPCTHAYSLINRCNKHMESSEENIKLRSITGGCLHKRSFVFHIEHDGNLYQCTKHHLNTATINLRLVRIN